VVGKCWTFASTLSVTFLMPIFYFSVSVSRNLDVVCCRNKIGYSVICEVKYCTFLICDCVTVNKFNTQSSWSWLLLLMLTNVYMVWLMWSVKLELDCWWTKKPLALNLHIFLFPLTVKSQLEAVNRRCFDNVLWHTVPLSDNSD